MFELFGEHVKILNIKENINLFHITPKNTPENYEEWDFIKQLPTNQKYGININSPMYFGLTEEFTLYYDNNYMLSTSEFQCVHLKFTTNKSLTLLEINDKGKLFEKHNELELNELLVQNNIDGFIAMDDVSVGWKEIYLIKPYQVLHDEHIVLNHDLELKIEDYNGYLEKEHNIIKHFIISPL